MSSTSQIPQSSDSFERLVSEAGITTKDPTMTYEDKAGSSGNATDIIKEMATMNIYRKDDRFSGVFYLIVRGNPKDGIRKFLQNSSEAEPWVWENVLKSLAKRNYNRQFRELFTTMLKSGVQPTPHIYHLCSFVLEEDEEHEKALTMIETVMNDIKHVPLSWTILFRLLAKLKKYDLMDKYYGDYMKAIREKKIIPLTSAFNILLSTYGKLSIPKMESLLADFKSVGLETNTYILTTVLTCYSNASDLKGLSKVLVETIESKTTLNAHLLSAVMSAMVKLGDTNSVVQLFEEMSKSGIESGEHHYSILILAYARSGQPEKAREIYDRMNETGVVPSQWAFNAVIEAYSRADQLEKLKTFLKEHGDPNSYTSTTFHALVAVHVRHREYYTALALYDELKSRNMPVVATMYPHIIRAASEVGDSNKMMDIWREALDHPTFFPHQGNFHIAMKLLAKKGKSAELLWLYKVMIKRKLKPDVFIYDALIAGSARAGEFEAMIYFHDAMIKNGCESNQLTNTSMLVGYARAGKYDEMLKFLDEIKSKYGAPSRPQYNTLIHAYARHGDYERISAVLDLMSRDSVQPDQVTLSHVLSSRQSSGFSGRIIDQIRYLMKDLKLRTHVPPFLRDMPEIWWDGITEEDIQAR